MEKKTVICQKQKKLTSYTFTMGHSQHNGQKQHFLLNAKKLTSNAFTIGNDTQNEKKIFFLNQT